MVLLSIRSGFDQLTLSVLFGISVPHISHLLQECKQVIVKYLVPVYLHWLNTEEIKRHTPDEIREFHHNKYPLYNVNSLIAAENCEVLCPRSYDLDHQWKAWSINLKKFNSLKQFLMVLADGLVICGPNVFGGVPEAYEVDTDEELYRELENAGVALMVLDRGFDNWKKVPQNIMQKIPPFLQCGQEKIQNFFYCN